MAPRCKRCRGRLFAEPPSVFDSDGYLWCVACGRHEPLSQPEGVPA